MIVKNVEKKENNTAMLQVEIDAESFDKAINGAYKKLKGRINVPGFRKGKAPRMVIEGMFGADVFYEDAMESLAPEAFEYAVGEEKLDTVGMPSIVDFNVDDAKVLTITFSTELYPEVTLGQYKGLEGVYAEAEVTDEEVGAALADARKRNARFVDVDRPVQQGDSIVLDFEGFVDGVAFEGGKADNYTLEIGSGAFIPGFEDQLVGLAAGQEGEVKVTFPEQYAENLAGKDAVFKVKVHTVREPELPELDDEFAKDVSDTCETLDDLKKEISDRLKKERQEAADRAFEDKLMDVVIEGMKADIPQAMVESQIDSFVQDFGYRLQMQGMTLEQYIKMTGTEMGAFRAMFRDQADRQVKTRLALEKVAELENIAVSDKELDEEYAKMAEQYGMEVDKVKSIVSAEALSGDLKISNALELIKKNAKVKKPAAKKKAAEETEATEETAE